MGISAVLVLLVLPGALAGPVQWQAGTNMCATHCPESNKYKYESGSSYEYSYEAETRTTMSGAAEDTATIALTATVVVDVIDHCEMILRLTKVVFKRSHEQYTSRMVEVDDMSAARRALEDRPLHFAFYDGAVGELCPGNDEELWSLNLKRGVLTSFQNSMRQLDKDELLKEVDVTGHCPTHYQVTQKGLKSMTVSKSKDMLSCTDRHGYHTSLLSTPYHSPHGLQSLPLMKSSHECQHTINRNDGILQRSSCHEVHVFRPFSKANSGASTEIFQTLTFQQESSRINTPRDPIGRRTTLAYEHKLGMNTGESSFTDVKNKLQELCEVTQADIRPQVPHIFGDLVHKMRDLDYSDLKNLDRQLQRSRFCKGDAQKTRKFFQDALPMAATGASLRMMSNLLTSSTVNDAQMTFWMTSLAFISNPTKDTIAAVQPLLTSQKTQQDAMLAVSAMVNNYCEVFPDCAQEEDVQKVLETLTEIIGSDCSITDDNLKQVLLTLRAIGNIGRSEALSLHLQPCFTKSDLAMDIRVAALDAYRRMPCSADRNGVMEIFLRHSEDSELRVAAYLTVMKCPTDAVLTQVRQALLDEEVNQVGSFVWTHLTNLLETQSPHKQAIREVLENELLQREFSNDRRKFSRNYELSFFSEKFNLGGIYENNLVWSASSFIPRSAMLNLTVDVFGHSVNLLEVGGRVQGLEYLLETYYGPSSHDNGKEGGYGSTDVVKNSKMAFTKKKFGQVKDDLRAQMYLRVFGNELSYNMVDSSNLKKLREGKAKSFFDDIVKKLMKEGDVSFTQSSTFMDSSIVVATALGLPLNLTVNGSATVELQASQKMNFKQINAKSKAFEIDGMLQPSGAVEFSSMMRVDAFVTQVGLKMTSSLHTSTSMKGRVELSRGQIFSVEIDTPRKTQEIFSFQSKFYIMHDSFEKEQEMVTTNRRDKTSCTGSALAKVLGLELCASLSFPNATLALGAPYFPFTGPTSISLMLHKRDTHSEYRLFAKQIQTSASVVGQLSLDTPGSKVDRAVSLGYILRIKDKSFEADLLSPWKKASMKGSLFRTSKRITANGALTLDTDQEYKVQWVMDREKVVRERAGRIVKMSLSPSVQITSHKGTHLSLNCSMNYRYNKQLKTKLVLQMKDVLKKPITFDYTRSIRARPAKSRYRDVMKLTSQFALMKMSTKSMVGSFPSKERGPLITVQSALDFSLPVVRVKRNMVNLNFKVNDHSTKALRKYGVDLNFVAKQTPEANLKIRGEMSHKRTLTELELSMLHGKYTKAPANNNKKLVIAGFVAHDVDLPKATVRFDLKALYPEKDIEYQIKGKHEQNKKMLEDYFSVRYAKGKSIDAHFRMDEEKKKRSATFDLNYPMGKTYPARVIKMNADLMRKSSTHHILSLMVSLEKGKKNSAVVSYKRPKPDSVEISSELGLHGHKPIVLDVSGNYGFHNMKGHGQLLLDDKTYRLDYTSDINVDKYAKFTLDTEHPERRIKCMLEGGKDVKNAVKRGKMEIMWDVNNDPSKKVGVTMELADKINPTDINIGGMVEVLTPVKEYEQVKAELRFENSAQKILTVAETVLGGKQKKYSAKFMVMQPVTENNFQTVAWLKTPHRVLRHAEMAVNHTFDSSSKLSTSVKGVFNKDFVEMSVSGSKKGNLIVRVLEGSAIFKSSIPGGELFDLSFNHRDGNGQYTTQTVMDLNGDQYSAIMEADFRKVHWQITTSGTLTLRSPQLNSPVKLIWTHSNNLHELTSTATVKFKDDEVHFEVASTANIVGGIYDGKMKLRGPFNDGSMEHSSQLDFHFKGSEQDFDLTVNLQLEEDTYKYKLNSKNPKPGKSKYTTELTMSKYPELNFECKTNMQLDDFPYVMSVELIVAEKPLLNMDVQIQQRTSNSYRSQSKVVIHLEDSVKTVGVTARHEKNRRNQWVTRGEVEYDIGHAVAFHNVLDYENNKKFVSLEVDTSFIKARNIKFQYSHSGNVMEDFTATSSLSVKPQFDTVKAKLAYSNRALFKGSLRVDTPFKEMSYLEVVTQSEMKTKSKRHSSLSVDYSPHQKYKLDTSYTFDLPSEVDLMLNVTTPHKLLPSLYAETGFRYTDDEVAGKFKLNSPTITVGEVSTTFDHKHGPASLSTQLDAVTSPGKRWSGSAKLNWLNEIDGTLSVHNGDHESQPFEVVLSHRGHTWEDFRTKAGFKMNGDRLETEVAYSNIDDRRGLFMIATPDPDIKYFKTSFFQRLTEDTFEGRYSAQYGEESKPFELGLSTTFSEDKIGFMTDLKTPHTDDLAIEIGFGGHRRVEVKLFGMYGPKLKIDTLIKYKIRDELWDVGAEFDYLILGSGHSMGFTFNREGPLDNLQCHSSAKYMGKQVKVDLLYKDRGKRSGRVDVHTTFPGYSDMAASFDHTGNSEAFKTNIYLKYQDDKEARGSIDFVHNNWRRVDMITTFRLPVEEYQDNKFTYKHIYRRNKVSVNTVLKLGDARAINGEIRFIDNSRLTMSVTGPYKDFESFSGSMTYDKEDKKLEGTSILRMLSQQEPITSNYLVQAGKWPVLINIETQTPYQDWSNVLLSITHDGSITDFTTSSTLTADAVGTVTSELTWLYTSPFIFDGKWTLTSSMKGAEDLKLFVKNTKVGNQYSTHLTLGWELLKESALDASLQLYPDSEDHKCSGSISLTTPFAEASQLGISFDHRHSDEHIQDSVITRFNDRTYLDTVFSYTMNERRVGSLQFREPRPMEFLIGGKHTQDSTEGELKLNWDKRDPASNMHITGEYTDRTDGFGTDKVIKIWLLHPARIMGVEYVLKKANKEFQNDFLLTWDKTNGQTLSYIISWTDRSSRYSSVYDAMVKVGMPTRSVQVDGVYSNTGRSQAAEGSLMWDVERDKNLKVGLKGQLDKRGKTNKMQLGLDFFDKEYTLSTETAVNSGNTLIDTRTEFSYNMDPQKLLVITTRIDDLSFGGDATNYSLALGIVHPMTNVDIQMTSHMGKSPTLSSVGTKFVYMTAQREIKIVEMGGQINKLKRQIGLQLKSPIKDWVLEGKVSGQQSYNVHLSTTEDGQKSEFADIYINPETKTLEMTYKYDKVSPSNSLNLFAKMIDDQMLQTEVYRITKGQRISESLITLRLNSSHVLHTRFNWRPHMLTELQQFLSTQLTAHSYGSSQAFQFMTQAIGLELEEKYQIIMQEILEETRPLLQLLQKEMSQLESHMSIMQQDIRRFYQRNALHVRDMGQIASKTIESMLNGLQYAVIQYQQKYTQMFQYLNQATMKLGQFPMSQKYSQLITDFVSGLKNGRMVLEQALDELSGQLSQFSDYTYRRYLSISRRIQRKLQGYTAALRQTPQFQGLASAYNIAQSSLQQLSQGQYKQLADAAHEKLLAALDELGVKDTYLGMVAMSKQLIADQFHDLVRRPEVQQVYVISREIYQQGVWAYHYWQVKNNTKLAVAQLIELTKDIILLEITRIKNAVVDLDKSRVIVFDPENGEFQFEIYLPVPLKSLTEPPDLRLTKYVNRVKSWAATYIPSPKLSLWATMNNYLPHFNKDTWMPPYQAYAYVIAEQHVVTFDHRHYSFAGRCSYILARDMLDDRFTVVLNYNDHPRQPQVNSLVVMLRGVAIEVTRDNMVLVNKQKIELPYFHGSVSVIRKRSIVRIQDGESLTVEMDSERSIYSVAVSGWYHGRTAGLLGVYDNEPYSDMMDSTHQMTTDVEALTNSWEVSRRYCRSRTLAEFPELDRSLEEVQACEKHLNHSTSYYAPCFGQVDAGELVRVCVEYVRQGQSMVEAQCKAGQQYRYMCHRQGVILSTPTQCVTCQLQGGVKMTSEGSHEVKSSPDGSNWKSADIVFVVEENECNSWAQQLLPALATQLGQALKTKGLTDNQFGLLSYSGNRSHDKQLMHTIEGKVFGEPSNLLKATENLRLGYPGDAGDVNMALREAIKYPFRVGVAKMLILLPCSSCAGDFLEVRQVLTSHGFVLHVLGAHDFKVTKPASLSRAHVFGLDLREVYTEKAAVKNKSIIFDHLEKPTDACTQLALSTNGSVFDISHLSKRGNKKQFLESFATRGAVNAVSPDCQICSCHDDGTGRGHTVCTLCDNSAWMWNHIPKWLQSGGTSVIGVFNDLHHQIVNSIEIPKPEVAASA